MLPCLKVIQHHPTNGEICYTLDVELIHQIFYIATVSKFHHIFLDNRFLTHLHVHVQIDNIL